LIGIDFSEILIKGANYLTEKHKNELKSTPEFIHKDAIEYIKMLPDDNVKYVLTERFIQNLPSVQVQKDIIKQVYRILEKSGRLLLCEGSKKGFDSLNDFRNKVGLSKIPDTSADNISALRIDDDELEEFIKNDTGFKLIKKLGFSEYFIVSRVLQPLMIFPLKPHFDSQFNKMGKLIQENMEFSPGIGSNTLWILEKI